MIVWRRVHVSKVCIVGAISSSWTLGANTANNDDENDNDIGFWRNQKKTQVVSTFTILLKSLKFSKKSIFNVL